MAEDRESSPGDVPARGAADVGSDDLVRAREVLEYNWPGQRIWGATAAILYNLRQRLEGLA